MTTDKGQELLLGYFFFTYNPCVFWSISLFNNLISYQVSIIEAVITERNPEHSETFTFNCVNFNVTFKAKLFCFFDSAILVSKRANYHII